MSFKDKLFEFLALGLSTSKLPLQLLGCFIFKAKIVLYFLTGFFFHIFRHYKKLNARVLLNSLFTVYSLFWRNQTQLKPKLKSY